MNANAILRAVFSWLEAVQMIAIENSIMERSGKVDGQTSKRER